MMMRQRCTAAPATDAPVRDPPAVADVFSLGLQGGKGKLLISSEYVNKTEKIGGMWTNTNSYRENTIFSREIFYVTTVLCLNIL